jgi:hypothetical protein
VSGFAFEPSPTIGARKATAIRVMMGFIMFLTGTYVGFDWAGFYYHFTSPYPSRAGYARTVLCAVLVWMLGKDCVDRRDARLLGAAFGITVIADWFLIVRDETLPGTALFFLVHGLLIVRHAAGLRASLSPARRARSLRFLIPSAIVAYGGAAALMITVAPILQRTGMLALDAAYVLVLTTSMWMAWGTLTRGHYARRNAWYVAIGMTCFFCCDVTVGLSVALKGTTPGAVLNNLIGFFYSPALVLLAYSGYHWAPAKAPAPSLAVAAS